MANVWIEVLDTPIDGHQKGEVFEIDEHYAKRFIEQEKAKEAEPPKAVEPDVKPQGKSMGKAAEVANPQKSA